MNQEAGPQRQTCEICKKEFRSKQGNQSISVFGSSFVKNVLNELVIQALRNRNE
jgi:hypothetical protein